MRCGVLSHVGYSLQRVGCQVQALGIETPCIFVRALSITGADIPACRACSRGTSTDPNPNVNYFVFLKFLAHFLSSLSLCVLRTQNVLNPTASFWPDVSRHT